MRFALVALTACGYQHGTLAGDGSGPDVAAVDSDGDGVADATDNCPTVSNAAQADEDGDALGDACDPCPHIAGDDADSDLDGIGDSCDPRVGIDRLVVFLGFNDAADAALFQMRSGTNQWSVSGGALHQVDPVLAMPQQIVWTGEAIHGTVVADTRAHIDSVPAGTGTRLVAVVAAWYDGTTVDAYACGLRGSDANVAATVAAWHFVNPPTVNGLATAATTGTISDGKQAAVHLVATKLGTDSSLDCRADTDPVTLAISGYIPDGLPGFRTFNVTGSFDYLFVVAVGM
jgi:hypothetical protein